MANTTHQGTHEFTGAVTLAGGVTGNSAVTGALTVTSGGATVTAGGLTVTAGAAVGALYHTSGAVKVRLV